MTFISLCPQLMSRLGQSQCYQPCRGGMKAKRHARALGLKIQLPPSFTDDSNNDASMRAHLFRDGPHLLPPMQPQTSPCGDVHPMLKTLGSLSSGVPSCM
jgi:hypothetical protein